MCRLLSLGPTQASLLGLDGLEWLAYSNAKSENYQRHFSLDSPHINGGVVWQESWIAAFRFLEQRDHISSFS